MSCPPFHSHLHRPPLQFLAKQCGSQMEKSPSGYYDHKHRGKAWKAIISTALPHRGYAPHFLFQEGSWAVPA
jgi:hypothetical protein